MKDFPHHYTVTAAAGADGDLDVEAQNLPALAAASPVEFDGPGDRWSPETLVAAAVAGCFILTFRAIARASQLAWTSLRCDVIGTLERVDRVTQFTRFDIRADLEVAEGTHADQAGRALEKAERTCLISNSLKAERHLIQTVREVSRAR